MDIKEQVATLFELVRDKRPLVHHITNYVTVNDCANVVLAIGASPIMADEISEVEEMVSLCNALVLNIGTANERTIASMLKAGQKANALGIPIVLDPVGVGATSFRLSSAKALLEALSFSVIRGNMAEIKTLIGLESKSAGVDSLDDESDGAKVALRAAQQFKCTVAITGAVDFVSDGLVCYALENGDRALTTVTGTGCMSTALIGSFLGASKNALLSAIAGISAIAIAGEIAPKTLGSGSFRVGIIDAISYMNPTIFLLKIKAKKIN